MTMCNTQTLMVFCLLGALTLLAGAERASSNRRGREVQRRKGRQSRGNAMGDTVDLILDPSSTSAPIPPLHQLGNNSMSPWTTKFTFNNALFPAHIAEAKCSLKGCLNASGKEVMDFESKPIYYQIQVLRRISKDHRNYAFKLETKTISVGCTCVRPNVLHQQ